MGSEKSRWSLLLGWSGGLLGASVIVCVLTVGVAVQKDPSRLAVGLLQGIALVLGTAGSYVFGRDASRENAEAIREMEAERLSLPARSAFRRVRTLWRALGRQQEAIRAQEQRLDALADLSAGTVQLEHARNALLALEYMVIEQIGTVDDALEDWRDLVPDEIAKIEEAGRQEELTDD
ncbi:hypothetical protein [Aeromicrobium sp. HA]|uniref:hypothetical protein n=1 Tax=Aeromicrobium sp. HA TaxID=3009077 RepID=UPI0022B00CF6|nr:hypothetical protein [Aeromicrobium sp. HA]